jgi:hypothetical protein
MEASELVHVARYALQLFGTLQGQEIYQKQHIDVDTKPPIVGGARCGLRWRVCIPPCTN